MNARTGKLAPGFAREGELDLKPGMKADELLMEIGATKADNTAAAKAAKRRERGVAVRPRLSRARNAEIVSRPSPQCAG